MKEQPRIMFLKPFEEEAIATRVVGYSDEGVTLVYEDDPSKIVFCIPPRRLLSSKKSICLLDTMIKMIKERINSEDILSAFDLYKTALNLTEEEIKFFFANAFLSGHRGSKQETLHNMCGYKNRN